ncbi:MAG: YARHG domain-containing protein [Eubacteriales bacterium]|nr:YARHG domain-containing protein [Eubacteriales bacterium]
MTGHKYDDGTVKKMMVRAVFIVCLVITAVIASFMMLEHKQKKIEAASGSSGQEEITVELATETAQDESSESGSRDIYLIKGKEQGSNRYERADRLAYTDAVCYTWTELSCLDSYGLCITRNEIYARHGRMFNDQDIQDFFNKQDWYVAKYSSADFNEKSLNEIEKYNVALIRSYELKQGY